MLAIKKKKDQIVGEEKKRENDARIRAKINVARTMYKENVDQAYKLIKKGGQKNNKRAAKIVYQEIIGPNSMHRAQDLLDPELIQKLTEI